MNNKSIHIELNSFLTVALLLVSVFFTGTL